mmetsp:Transcript_108630/g.302919  ORF Transcript_108630/g.302919 Transcript_108630/m.302919 type:complete len:248 (+) Transcript_108630:430-1173(+)
MLHRRIEGQGVDDVLVVFDEECSHRTGYRLDGRIEKLSALFAPHGGIGDGKCEPIQRAALTLDGGNDELHREQGSHREEVEHVVDGGAREGALEHNAVAGLAHGHDGVGDGGADVGAHDDRDRRLHFQLIRADQTDYDGRARGGGLHHDRGKDARHEARDWVGDHCEHIARTFARQALEGVSQQLQTEKEQVKARESSEDAEKDTWPAPRLLRLGCALLLLTLLSHWHPLTEKGCGRPEESLSRIRP